MQADKPTVFEKKKKKENTNRSRFLLTTSMLYISMSTPNKRS